MQEDLRHHKEMHEHYRARCDVQQKVRALPVVLLEKRSRLSESPDRDETFMLPELVNSNGPIQRI